MWLIVRQDLSLFDHKTERVKAPENCLEGRCKPLDTSATRVAYYRLKRLAFGISTRKHA